VTLVSFLSPLPSLASVDAGTDHLQTRVHAKDSRARVAVHLAEVQRKRLLPLLHLGAVLHELGEGSHVRLRNVPRPGGADVRARTRKDHRRLRLLGDGPVHEQLRSGGVLGLGQDAHAPGIVNANWYYCTVIEMRELMCACTDLYDDNVFGEYSTVCPIEMYVAHRVDKKTPASCS
jgi:hypothetical protein